MDDVLKLIKEATKSVPATKYAVGVAGIAAIVALIASFKIDLRIALWGTIVLFGLMILLVVFAKLTQVASEDFRLPAMILMWAFVLLFIIVSILLTTSVFFKVPVNLQFVLTEKKVALNADSTSKDYPAAHRVKIRKKEIHFVTEIAKISEDSVKIFFNITNGTDSRILISLFGIEAYDEEITCHYMTHSGRYGLDLFLDKPSDELSFNIGSGEILPFTARIKYKAYSCADKCFGIYFKYNDLDGDIFYKPSDAIYFINDEGKLEYLRPGRFERLLDTKNPKSFTYQFVDDYAKEYYDKSKNIYNKHINAKIFEKQ